ncbi:MAG: dihydroorotase [Thermoplasmatota archaeon]
MDLVVRGRVVRGSRVERLSIGIEAGHIVRIARHIDGDDLLDVGDSLVLPAATDLHVHFRDPGAPAKEDFGSGSEAAAHGGVTTVLDMPNTNPPTTTRAALRAKILTARTKSLVDFGIYAGLTPDPKSAELLKEATALKVYMGSSTGDLLVTEDAPIRAGLAASKATGKIMAFHAESDACLHEAAEPLRGHMEPEVWSRARPARCEADAIARIRRLAPRGARPHIAHLSTDAGLRALAGARISAEVTPHHLFATQRDLASDRRWKMNPPLRTRRDQAALWAALRRGTIAAIASDHAPHLPAEKARGIWDAPSGVPGVETMVPLMLAAWKARRLPLERVVAACCENPASLIGAKKGRIEEGFDADLMIVDPSAEAPIQAARLHSRCGWTPFEGFRAIFPSHVLLRGNLIVEDGATVGRAGKAQFLSGAPRPKGRASSGLGRSARVR